MFNFKIPVFIKNGNNIKTHFYIQIFFYYIMISSFNKKLYFLLGDECFRISKIGTGSGYQAAILSLVGARVYTIERQQLLHQKAKKLLDALKFEDILFYYGDGYKGLPRFAPFDKIIVTAGAPEVPKVLLSQLKIGGFMVIPVGEDSQQMHHILKVSQTEYRTQVLDTFRFVPFLKGTNKLGS